MEFILHSFYSTDLICRIVKYEVKIPVVIYFGRTIFVGTGRAPLRHPQNTRFSQGKIQRHFCGSIAIFTQSIDSIKNIDENIWWERRACFLVDAPNTWF